MPFDSDLVSTKDKVLKQQNDVTWMWDPLNVMTQTLDSLLDKNDPRFSTQYKLSSNIFTADPKGKISPIWQEHVLCEQQIAGL